MRRAFWLTWLLWLAGAAFAQMDVRESYVDSDDTPMEGYPVWNLGSTYPFEVDWEHQADPPSWGEYADLGQATQIGSNYVVQPGAYVEDPNAGWMEGFLTITLYHRSAASVAELASATWEEVGHNPTPYDGGADPGYGEGNQLTLRYPVSTWDHRIMQWKILAQNSSTGESDQETTLRLYFGALFPPTPTPTVGPTPTPTVAPTATSTPQPSRFMWINYSNGKWHTVRTSP